MSATAAPTKRGPRRPAKERVYLARRANLVLIKTSDIPVRDEHGQLVDTKYGESVEFREGVLRVPLKGTIRGRRSSTLDAAGLIEWLEGDEEKGVLPHELLGDREEGFWPLEEPAPAPDERELDQIVTLAESSDLAGLDEFIAAEQDGHGREELLSVAGAARERVAARLAEEPKPEAS